MLWSLFQLCLNLWLKCQMHFCLSPCPFQVLRAICQSLPGPALLVIHVTRTKKLDRWCGSLQTVGLVLIPTSSGRAPLGSNHLSFSSSRSDVRVSLFYVVLQFFCTFFNVELIPFFHLLSNLSCFFLVFDVIFFFIIPLLSSWNHHP